MIFTTNLSKKIDAELLFTDTDSLTYKIKSKNVYENFFRYKHLFHFSEYQSKTFHPINKKVIGKINDR